jgi:hypothetical protein
MNNKAIEEQYRQQFSNWSLWIDMAKELTRAAKFLDKHVDKDWDNFRRIINKNTKQIQSPILQDIQFMLYSYALENYFKALIIFTDPKMSEKPAKIKTHIKTHKLPQLAKYAEFKLEPKEAELLSRLWRNADWQGRYPVPLSPKKISSKYYTDGNRACTTVYSSEDHNEIKQLLKRVKNHVNSITKQSEKGNVK